MILGFVRRVRAERKLAETTKLLGADPLSAEGVADRVQILEQLARALDARDPFMVGHSLRVARSAEMVAGRMGLTSRLQADEGADRPRPPCTTPGKINTPTSILNKPSAADRRGVRDRQTGPGRRCGQMTCVRSATRRRRWCATTTSASTGAATPTPWPARASRWALGSIAVADTFDAITSVRPYRPPRNQHAALRILKVEAGTRLDCRGGDRLPRALLRLAAEPPVVIHCPGRVTPERLVGSHHRRGGLARPGSGRGQRRWPAWAAPS